MATPLGKNFYFFMVEEFRSPKLSKLKKKFRNNRKSTL
nr:MAG TPA: hypothetical protein [Myoviridae sp. ctTS62]